MELCVFLSNLFSSWIVTAYSYLKCVVWNFEQNVKRMRLDSNEETERRRNENTDWKTMKDMKKKQ